MEGVLKVAVKSWFIYYRFRIGGRLYPAAARTDDTIYYCNEVFEDENGERSSKYIGKSIRPNHYLYSGIEISGSIEKRIVRNPQRNRYERKLCDKCKTLIPEDLFEEHQELLCPILYKEHILRCGDCRYAVNRRWLGRREILNCSAANNSIFEQSPTSCYGLSIRRFACERFEPLDKEVAITA